MNLKITLMTMMGMLQLVHGVPLSGSCSSRIFVATSNGTSSSLVVSTDGGQSWTIRDPAATSPILSSISANGDNVIVGAYSGVVTSVNGGRSWTEYWISTAGPPYATFGFASSDRFIFDSRHRDSSGWADYDTPYISKDMGKTWNIMSQLPAPFYNSPLSAVYAIGNRSFICVNDPVNGGIGITDNDGKSWRIVGPALGLGSGQVTSISGFNDKIFAGLNRDGGCIAISEDGGDTWGTQNTIPTGSGIGAISVGAADGKVYVGTNGGGLAMSSSWWDKWSVKTSASGLINDTITGVGACGNTIVAGTPVGLSISADGGSTWVPKTSKDGLTYNNVTAVFVQCV